MVKAQQLRLTGRLSDVSTALLPGQITAICGPNGAGKSSLLACLAGLLQADSGAVTLAGAALHSIAPQGRAQAIGFLPQSPEVAWDVSVETLVTLGRLPWRSRQRSRCRGSGCGAHDHGIATPAPPPGLATVGRRTRAGADGAGAGGAAALDSRRRTARQPRSGASADAAGATGGAGGRPGSAWCWCCTIWRRR